MSQLSSKQADQLRVILTKLGPAFVKIGQVEQPCVPPGSQSWHGWIMLYMLIACK